MAEYERVVLKILTYGQLSFSAYNFRRPVAGITVSGYLYYTRLFTWIEFGYDLV